MVSTLWKSFEFENGETLENVEVEYLIKGTPKFDDCENITNLVVFCHGYEGNCLSLNELHSFHQMACLLILTSI